jgi:hypothetical protein
MLIFSYILNNEPRSACHGWGCIGDGLGLAIIWAGVSFIGFVAALLLNATSLFLLSTPRSVGRKVETGIFSIPVLLFLFLLAWVILIR